MKFHLTVPGHGIPARTPQMMESLLNIFRNTPEWMEKSCSIYVYNNIEFTPDPCTIVRMKGLWTDFFVDLKRKKITYDWVGVLLDDVKVEPKMNLSIFNRPNMNVLTFAFDHWHWKNMQSSLFCGLRRSKTLDILFTIMRGDTFRCFASQIKLNINHIGWGYDLSLHKRCKTDVVVDDTQTVRHIGDQLATRSYSTTRGMEELWTWLRFHFHWDCDGGESCMQALISYQNSQKVRCLTFAENVKVNFVDQSYFRSVTHKGGWNTIMSSTVQRYHHADARIAFIDCCESYFLWNRNRIKQPWVGMLHYTDNLPRKIYPAFETLEGLLLTETFQTSLKYCMGLIVLSKYSARMLESYSMNVPIRHLKHPISVTCDHEYAVPQSMDQIKNIVLLGQQYRRIATIFKLKIKTNKQKIWMPGTKDSRRLKEMMQREDLSLSASNVSVSYVEDYNQLLQISIVVLDLWDAAANNAVLDAISCGIPILVRRLPAVEEYLGKTYPLFFDDFADLQEMVDNLTLQQLKRGHEHMVSIDRSELSISNFQSNLEATLKDFAQVRSPET